MKKEVINILNFISMHHDLLWLTNGRPLVARQLSINIKINVGILVYPIENL